MNGNLEEHIIKLTASISELIRVTNDLSEKAVVANKRINDLEVKLDNLRVEFDNHSHKQVYVPPPVYGG